MKASLVRPVTSFPFCVLHTHRNDDEIDARSNLTANVAAGCDQHQNRDEDLPAHLSDCRPTRGRKVSVRRPGSVPTHMVGIAIFSITALLQGPASVTSESVSIAIRGAVEPVPAHG